MEVSVLGAEVDLTAVAAQTAVDYTGFTTPFMPGRKVTVIVGVVSAVATAAGVLKIQGSDDNSTWVDLTTCTGSAGKVAAVKLYNYMRANVTTAWGAAGRGTVTLLADSV